MIVKDQTKLCAIGGIRCTQSSSKLILLSWFKYNPKNEIQVKWFIYTSVFCNIITKQAYEIGKI